MTVKPGDKVKARYSGFPGVFEAIIEEWVEHCNGWGIEITKHEDSELVGSHPYITPDEILEVLESSK